MARGRRGFFRRIIERIFRPSTRVPVRERPPTPPARPPVPPAEPEREGPPGWELVGYYSPPVVDKDNWQNIEAGARFPSEDERTSSPVLTFRQTDAQGRVIQYRSFVGPTDASIEDIIAYLNDQYGLEAA